MIGAGAAARALLPALRGAGYPVIAVASRGVAGARSTGRVLAGVRLVLLAVSDRAIGTVATDLAAIEGVDWRRIVVLHHAGALGPEPLAPLARRGAATGVLHPLQCLGHPPVAATVLRGSFARIEGEPRARGVARRVARDLGLRVLPIEERPTADSRAAYHAAASLAANDVAVLLAIASGLLGEIGVPRRTACAALARLCAGVAAQIEAVGAEGSLTGPVARGDVATLRRQLRRLARSSPAVSEVHRLLSLEVLRLARGSGRIGAAAAREIRAALAPRGGRQGRRGV